MIDVSFQRVGKRYRVERPEAGGSMLRRWFPPREEFWAVREVSFEVARGETLGIVGHNGAGKSTLLKLLSRITAPTAGEITLTGSLAALIEVGSGFHPELTGRENIFLSGAILGMRRREIAAKLDRIVEFSGVGPFIDTPVKRYSSGMFVRLGFSIAAHLEPDILLVDEVLAVGDAAFQVQCYERLSELRRAGTTMLFISHDLVSIEKLCDRVILMERGRLRASGAPAAVIAEYQRMAAAAEVSSSATAAAIADASSAVAAPAARISGVTFGNPAAETTRTKTGEPLSCRIEYDVDRPVDDAVVEVFFYSRDGRTLLCQCTTALSGGELRLAPGPGVLEFLIPEFGLQPGVYSIGATIRRRPAADTIDWFYGRTQLYVEPGRSVRGYFYTPHSWRVVTQERTAASAAGGRDAAHRHRPHV
jgi:ABC-type polysaccharide/polyol phosphate transport system ATPase subunit